MSNNVLSGDEWIGFQTMEGPCSAGCKYCYEREKTLSLLKKAQEKGKIENFDGNFDNKQLATFIRKNKNNLGFFLDIKEFERYFQFLREANINRAFLVGSEPTEHPDFEKILDSAKENGISLLIYTSGRNLDKLTHSSIKFIVLHLDYENQKKYPHSKNYFDKINNLLAANKEIHFRVNFDSNDLREKELIFNFYNKVKKIYRKKLLLKFSFTTKLCNVPRVRHFTPNSMKKISNKIIEFIDEFKSKFPEVPIISERPLFLCAFEKNEWIKYQQIGGFTSKCEMEFVVYPKEGLSLCPPARDLIEGKDIKSSQELIQTISEMKKQLTEICKKPSFDVCKKCIFRLDNSCQGGCFGYKE